MNLCYFRPVFQVPGKCTMHLRLQKNNNVDRRVTVRVFGTGGSKTNKTSFDFVGIRQEILQIWLQAEGRKSGGMQTKARYCCFTYHDGERAYNEKKATWHWLDQELSSNYAGETGAVSIYKGALAALNVRNYVLLFKNKNNNNNDAAAAVDFITTHMDNEASHLALFEKIVPEGKHTTLLPIWRVAGYMLGFVPTIFGGTKALYVTVVAVESFVEEHYQAQIRPLKKEGMSVELVRLLEHCCEDEVHHREDAAQKLLANPENLNFETKWWMQIWSAVVRTGSIVAADVSRRV